MKNIITKIIIGCAVLGVAGMLYWYYDSGSGFGSLGLGGGQVDDGAAIVSMSDLGDGSSSTVIADGSEAGDVGDVGSVAGDGSFENGGDDSGGGIAQKSPDNKTKAVQRSADASGEITDDGGDANGVLSAVGVTGSDSSTQDALAAENAEAGTLAATSVSTPMPMRACSFVPPNAPVVPGVASGNSPSRGVILNEIAWMGSVPEAGETSAKASNREWIELKNISAAAVDLGGWQIFDSAGNLKIVVASSAVEIAPGGFYLLVRDGQSLAAANVGADASSASGSVSPDAGYAGGLSNSGDQLELFDPNCNVLDFLDASAGWPGGNNTTKQTLERDANGVGWHTSAAPGGTPRAENSMSAPAPVAPASSSTPTMSPTTPVASSNASAMPQQYLISVSMTGGGEGTISSSPAGILCGFDCEASYAAGTKLTFAETPAQGSQFAKWSGACAGAASAGGTATQCSFIVSSSAPVVADFESVPPPETPVPLVVPSSTSIQNSAESSSTASSSDLDSGGSGSDGNSGHHLLIAAVQIAGPASGGESSNDFVKIFNPTGASVDLSGWKLHKKSSTGTDYSLKSLVAGSTIAPGGYFEWANSTDGFADSIGADASSTETLSADNSVALFDANGNIIDQVAWGTGTNQYVEGTAYPTDPTAGQVLARTSAAGAIVDTDDNATDFAIN